VLWKKQVVPEKRKQTKAVAEKAFKEAATADPGDHLPRFYLALLAAQARRLPEAMKHVRAALARRNDHQPSLHLLALLLSATKDYPEALSLTEATLKEYPTSLPLLYLKATLEEQVLGGEAALLTAKDMLSQWRAVFEEQEQAAVDSAGQNAVSPQFNHEDSGLDSLSYSGDTLDKDNASIAGSVAVVSF
jgi:tetratricopeptide (TPR) repeat protein